MAGADDGPAVLVLGKGGAELTVAPGVGRDRGRADCPPGGNVIDVDAGTGSTEPALCIAKLLPGGRKELTVRVEGPTMPVGGTDDNAGRGGVMFGAGCIKAPRAAFIASDPGGPMPVRLVLLWCP